MIVEAPSLTESTTVTVVVPYGVSEVWDFRNFDPNLMAEVYCSAIRNAAQVTAGLWLTASPEGHADGGAGLTHHVFGRLTPAEALRFLTVHNAHHTRQLTTASV